MHVNVKIAHVVVVFFCQTLSLRVRAVSGQRSSQALVLVTVTDINDNQPLFGQKVSTKRERNRHSRLRHRRACGCADHDMAASDLGGSWRGRGIRSVSSVRKCPSASFIEVNDGV